MCNVPFVIAPQLFDEVKDDQGYLHCYVKRQPETEEEHGQMLEVLASAELSCVRFKGRDYSRQSSLVQTVPSLMDHIDPRLFHRYLLGLIKARWAIYKWRTQHRKRSGGRN
jgi:hypothetical protein